MINGNHVNYAINGLNVKYVKSIFDVNYGCVSCLEYIVYESHYHFQ